MNKFVQVLIALTFAVSGGAQLLKMDEGIAQTKTDHVPGSSLSDQPEKRKPLITLLSFDKVKAIQLKKVDQGNFLEYHQSMFAIKRMEGKKFAAVVFKIHFADYSDIFELTANTPSVKLKSGKSIMEPIVFLPISDVEVGFSVQIGKSGLLKMYYITTIDIGNYTYRSSLGSVEGDTILRLKPKGIGTSLLILLFECEKDDMISVDILNQTFSCN